MPIGMLKLLFSNLVVLGEQKLFGIATFAACSRYLTLPSAPPTILPDLRKWRHGGISQTVPRDL